MPVSRSPSLPLAIETLQAEQTGEAGLRSIVDVLACHFSKAVPAALKSRILICERLSTRSDDSPAWERPMSARNLGENPIPIDKENAARLALEMGHKDTSMIFGLDRSGRTR